MTIEIKVPHDKIFAAVVVLNHCCRPPTTQEIIAKSTVDSAYDFR